MSSIAFLTLAIGSQPGIERKCTPAPKQAANQQVYPGLSSEAATAMELGTECDSIFFKRVPGLQRLALKEQKLFVKRNPFPASNLAHHGPNWASQFNLNGVQVACHRPDRYELPVRRHTSEV
jgi:hypothetical protein